MQIYDNTLKQTQEKQSPALSVLAGGKENNNTSQHNMTTEIQVDATLTKANIAQELSDTFGFNKRESKELVEQFYEEISNVLIAGEQIKLSGFGNFELRDKSSRPGRNPRTGEDVPISARRVVTFKPGQKLRSKIDAFDGIE